MMLIKTEKKQPLVLKFWIALASISLLPYIYQVIFTSDVSSWSYGFAAFGFASYSIFWFRTSLSISMKKGLGK